MLCACNSFNVQLSIYENSLFLHRLFCVVIVGGMIHHIIDFLMLCVFVNSNICLIYLCGDLVFLTLQLFLFAVGFGGDRFLFWDYKFLLRHERLAIGVICFCLPMTCFFLEMTCMCLKMKSLSCGNDSSVPK